MKPTVVEFSSPPTSLPTLTIQWPIGENGEVLAVVLFANGTMEIRGNVQVDEAVKRFWEAIADNNPLIPALKAAESRSRS